MPSQNAKIAQLVERGLAKSKVAGSSPVFCSNIRLDKLVVIILFKSRSPIAAAEDRKGKGLVRIQSRIQNADVVQWKHGPL